MTTVNQKVRDFTVLYPMGAPGAIRCIDVGMPSGISVAEYERLESEWELWLYRRDNELPFEERKSIVLDGLSDRIKWARKREGEVLAEYTSLRKSGAPYSKRKRLADELPVLLALIAEDKKLLAHITKQNLKLPPSAALSWIDPLLDKPLIDRMGFREFFKTFWWKAICQ